MDTPDWNALARLAPQDPHGEARARLIAPPIALALALLLHASSLGQFVQRTWLTMPVHELGHAMAAWLTGHLAIPTLWKTIDLGHRGSVAVAVSNALGALTLWAWHRHVVWGVWAALLWAGQLWLTWGLTPQAIDAFITFWGDGGAMVLGTVLMLSFFVPATSPLRLGGARWGLLFIGANALVDPFATWWAARTHLGAMPYGEIEGTGLSDAAKLIDVHGWPIPVVIRRYVSLGLLCLAVLTVGWLLAWTSARRAAAQALPMRSIGRSRRRTSGH